MTITHERCYYCNKVSSRDIETNAEEFTKKRFFRDPVLLERMTCEDCKEVIEEAMLEYEKQDDIYGWSVANENTDLRNGEVLDKTYTKALATVDSTEEIPDFDVD